MAKFYFISPTEYSSPDLYPSFIETFKNNGHEIINDINSAEVVLFDFHTRLGEYNQSVLDIAIKKTLPIISFDEWDRGAMSLDEWPYPLTEQQLLFINAIQNNGNRAIHFVRKLDKTKEYPSNIYPYEKCLMNDFPLTTPNELFSRPYEIFFGGNKSTARLRLIKGLLGSSQFNMDIHWTHEKGKLSQEEWVNRARQSKLFLTADGAGFTDERMQQLITVSPMLKQKSNHYQVVPFADCVNCLMISEQPTEDEIKEIKRVLQDKEYLYEVYLLGIDHAKKYYTQEWRSLYVLKILTENNII